MAQNNVTARPSRIVLIGGSAGALNGVLAILPELNVLTSIAVVIILHRKPSGENILVNLLGSKINWTVKEAEEKDDILAQHIYIAPADYHLLLEKDYSFSLDASEKVHYSRPSIDVTFQSAAEVFGRHTIAVLLSGANTDGAEGMQRIKSRGGYCIVQEPESAEVSIMPREAIDTVAIDKVLPAEQIADHIKELIL